MANRNLTDLIKARDDAKKSIGLVLTTATGKKRLKPDEAIAALENMIARQTERLEATKASLDATVKRVEGEIRRREQRIAELGELVKRQRGAAKKRPSKKKKKPDRPKLREVSGVGPKFARGLEAAGIKSVAELSRAPVKKVVEALGVTDDKARSLIDSAQQLRKKKA